MPMSFVKEANGDSSLHSISKLITSNKPGNSKSFIHSSKEIRSNSHNSNKKINTRDSIGSMGEKSPTNGKGQ